MRLILLIMVICKRVKGLNDTVFKDMDIEGIVEDSYNDPFLISKRQSGQETCSQVSFQQQSHKNESSLRGVETRSLKKYYY